MPESPPTAPRPRIIDLVAQLLSAEARLDVIGARVTDVRHRLIERAVEFYQAEGVAPTMRAPGLGTVSLAVPKDKVAVDDVAAFAGWASSSYPTEVTAVYRIPVMELPQALVDALEAAGVTPALEVNPTWQKGFLEKAACPDGVTVLDPHTGEIVDGLKLRPASLPSQISVRLDGEARNRASAEWDDGDVADGILSPLVPEAVAEPPYDVRGADPGPVVSRETGDLEHMDAEGEPDDDLEPPVLDEAPVVLTEARLTADYLERTVPELRVACAGVGLSDKGKKAELVARLVRNVLTVSA